MPRTTCRLLLHLVALIAAIGLCQCATGEVDNPDGDGDADADGDGDGDGDGDADADADADADTDTTGFCGDGECAPPETLETCPADCVSCGDGACTGTENALSCAFDCPAVCGDSFCTHGEDSTSCVDDCPASCGDGACAGSENPGNCPDDCPAACGDELCSEGEDVATCPEDCPPVCGDGVCSAALGETGASCPDDCPLSCGDGTCDADEDVSNCPGDCPAVCGDSLCTHDEDAADCPGDCPAICGDTFCTHSEGALTCPDDCSSECGDGGCTAGETAASCPGDCPAACPDGACTHEESATSCPDDCPASCGDGECTHTESASGCPGDCPAWCGDWACTHAESASSCPDDCPAECGDGACTHTEGPATCIIDCPAVCGDGACSGGETVASCAVDCGCAAPGACAGLAPSGCRCDASCTASGTCCADACAVCGSCACTVDGDVTASLGGASIVGSNATGRDAVDGCVYGTSQEAIYTVTPPFTGNLTASLANPATTYDTALSVRQGSCGGVEVACNDDFSGLRSQVTFAVTAGTTYYLIVEGFNGGTGTYELTVHREGVCEGVAPIVDGTASIANGTSVIDTSTGVSSLAGLCGGGSGNDGLLSFTAPRSGTMVASTNFAGTTYDTRLYARGSDCDSQGAELACNDDDYQNAFGSSTRSQVVFGVTAGTTYSLLADAFSSGSGPVEVGLGYGGTSPVQGAMNACGYGAAIDAYRVFVTSGETIHFRADTIAAATASDLCLQVIGTDGTTQIGSFDDNVACTYPPPLYTCPDGSITMTATGFITVRVNQCSTHCADASNAAYTLTVDRGGTNLVLMQTQDR